MWLNFNVPGGTRHVNGDTHGPVDQQAVFVSGQHLLTRFEAVFNNDISEGVEGHSVGLKRSRRHSKSLSTVDDTCTKGNRDSPACRSYARL